MLGDAWDANLGEIRQTGEVDLLCFTGDLAFSGRDHEYGSMDEARPGLFTVSELMSRTIAALGLSRDQVFVVPGNHDIDRDISAESWAEFRKLNGTGTRADADLLSLWMCGGEPPRGYQPELRELVLARQAAYRGWVQRHFGTRLLPRVERQAARPPQGHPNLGYRHSMRIGGHDVHILGLDSAWLAGDDHDAGKLWLTDDQVLRAATNHEGRELAGFRLALMHHPPGEIADGENTEKLLADRVDLLLRGHLHEAAVRTVGDPQRTFRIAAAGSLYERDKHRNGMQVIDVTLDHQGRPRGYEVWFRSWSSGASAWHDDDGVYAGSRQGRVAWRLEPPAARPEASTSPGSPRPPRPPRLPTRVVYEYPGAIVQMLHGRAEPYQKVMSWLRDPAVRISVISGRPGAGKTALACKVLADLISARDVDGVVMMSQAKGQSFSVAAVLAGLDQLNDPARRLGDAVLGDETRTFRSRLDAVLNRLGERDVIVLLDMFESLIGKTNELDRDVAELLRLILSHPRRRLRIVITTRQSAINELKDPKLFGLVDLSDLQGNDLDAKATEALLRSFEQAHRLGLSSATAEVFAEVHRLTRGNPYELEQIVRHLSQSHGLTLAGWVTWATAQTGKLDELQVKAMFNDANAVERAVLLAVAVAGDPAGAAHVAAMLAQLIPDLGRDLGEMFDTLCGRDQVHRCEGGYTLHPRDREILLGACARSPIEVAGRRFTTADVKRVDCEILEARVPDPARLSSAAQAKALVRAIAGRLGIGDLDRAREILLATADQLLFFGEVAFVADTAARLLEQPTPSESDRCWLYVRAGDAKGLLGERKAALAYYDEARRVATDELVIGVDVLRARSLVDLDRLDEATEALRRWGEDPRVARTPALESMYWHERAMLARELLRLDDAIAFERTALRSCAGDKDHGQRANLARALMSVGAFVEAERFIRASLEVSSRTLNRVFYANQLEIMSDVLLGRGDIAEAERSCRQSLAARRELGVAGFIARSLLRHGWLLELQGRAGEAAATYREALEIRRQLKDWKEEFPATAISVALAAGDLAAAAAALARSEVRTPASDRDRLLLGGLRLAQGDPAGAIGPFRQVAGQARRALAACDRNTHAGRRLVVALCGLVATGDDHDVMAEIDRFRSNIDSLGPMMELRHQLRVLHRCDRTGRSTPVVEHCSAMLT